MSMSDNEYRLPVFAHNMKIASIPGQDPHAEYVICKDIHEPKNGLGYIAQVVGRRKVRLLAWISDDTNQMHVYEMHEPCDTDDPDRTAQLHYHKWNEFDAEVGSVRVLSSDGLNRQITIGEMAIDGEKASMKACSVDIGVYQSGSHPREVVIAACWLAAYYLPVSRGEQVGVGAGRIVEIFAEMSRKALPDAVDELIWKGATNSDTASAFERYAARQLIEAGAGDLRPICSNNDVEMHRLDSTDMFWAVFNDNEVVGLQRDVLLSVESAMNRLAFNMLDAMEIDNDMGMVNTLDEFGLYKSTVDAFHMFEKHAKHIDHIKDDKNTMLTVRDYTAQRGGTWDVMSRFTATCETLMMSHRLEYRCDANPSTGHMEILFGAPIESMFPSSALTPQGWVDIKEQRCAHVASYTLRVAGLLAQAAFNAGTSITHVHVTANSGSLTGPCVLSLEFERTPFMMGVLPAYLHGAFDATEQDNDPSAILGLLHPQSYMLQFGANRGLEKVERLAVYPQIMQNRVPLWNDQRELPEDLQTLLRADRACELDVMRDNASIKGEEIRQIEDNNEDSAVAASLEIESALMQLEMELPQDNTRKLLYCDSPLPRLLVSLLDDNSATRYVKAPDALYNAHDALSRIECQMGNKEKAIAHTHALIELGPTTARSYIEEAIAQVDSDEDYASAINVLIKALPYAIMPMDAEFVLYRLAYALWNTNNLQLALAVYAHLITMPPSRFTELAKEESAELMRQMGEGTTMPEPNESEHAMQAANIPTPPVSASMRLIAHAAMRLTDAGFPLATEQAVWLLGATQKGDILPQLRRSLQYGVLDPQLVARMDRGEIQ